MALNVCMIIARFHPWVGGTEMQCLRLSRYLVAKGHRVSVLTERTSPDLSPQESIDGVQVVRLKAYGTPPNSSFRFAVGVMAYLLRNRNFDVLHAHMIAWPAIAALIAGKCIGKPVVVKVAGAKATGDLGTSRATARGKVKLNLLELMARTIVGPSRETLEELKSLPGLRANTHYIPNGVEIPNMGGDKRSLRKKLNLHEDRLIAVYAGRWAAGKGVELLLDTWKQPAQDNVQWDLVLLIPTDPPAEARHSLGALSATVRVFKSVPDLTPYYQAADLAVLLSRGEGQSNFLLEATACGLPTLTSQSAAIDPDQAPERRGIVLTDSELSAPAVRRALDQLQNHPDHLTELGRAARQWTAERFSMDRVGAQYEALYRQCINAKP